MKFQNGITQIIRSNTLRPFTPTVVFINRKGAMHVGDGAFSAHKLEKLSAMKDWNTENDNSFIEFTRTMGSDLKYCSSNANRSFNSIELSAEVLKTLKSFEKDETIIAAVITVPFKFGKSQIEHTREAAKLAGFDDCEIISEAEAVGHLYYSKSEEKVGIDLIFHFCEGTFDATLLSTNNEGIKVIDTEGNQYLGNKSLVEAIIDNIIIPYLKRKYAVDELLEDPEKNKKIRNEMKFYAQEIQEQLSFNEATTILSNLGNIPWEDDNGSEFELEISVNREDLELVIAPLIQRAIDISLTLLKRNGLDEKSISSLILVGGPTISPILRKMLSKQICTPDTSLDPITAVAEGAAVYASKIHWTSETENLNHQLQQNTNRTSFYNWLNNKTIEDIDESRQITTKAENTCCHIIDPQKLSVVIESLGISDSIRNNQTLEQFQIEELIFQLAQENIITSTFFQLLYDEISTNNNQINLHNTLKEIELIVAQNTVNH
ncbi:MAG: Hsp70 family protein [Bacteroidia bacterium]|nr:Hsp70 family protein [Bacteroidia bacterium]